MKIKIQKYDPSIDEKPYWTEGEVEYQEGMSALQALVEFHEKVEPVSFDMSCTGSSCGRCAMTLDGTPCLACITPITDEDHEFAPLGSFPVIRDLVVNKDLLTEKIIDIQQRKQVEPFVEADLTPKNYSVEDNVVIDSVERCIRCGVCMAACPVHKASPDEYIGPAPMIATAFRHLDPYDAKDRIADAVSDGLFRCILCGTCNSVCPQTEIDHLSVWKRLRADAEKAGMKPSYA